MHPGIMEALEMFVRAASVEHVRSTEQMQALGNQVIAWTLEHKLAPHVVKSTEPATVVKIIDRSESMAGMPLQVARCYALLNIGFLKLCHPSVEVVAISQHVDSTVMPHDDSELYVHQAGGTVFEPAYDLAALKAGYNPARYLFHISDGWAYDDVPKLTRLWQRAVRTFRHASYLEIERDAFGPHNAVHALHNLTDEERQSFTLSRIRIAY